MPVSSSTMVRDTVILLRDQLAANITDPSSEHTGDIDFVMTSYPEREVKYPVIIVDVENVSDEPAGIASEQRIVLIEFKIDIWARNVQERDLLQDRVYQYLRTYQIDASEALANNLWGFKINSGIHVDEEGKNSPHRAILRGKYNFVTE